MLSMPDSAQCNDTLSFPKVLFTKLSENLTERYRFLNKILNYMITAV